MERERKESIWTSYKHDILQKPVYWVCLAVITLLGFGFDLMNRSLSVDNLQRWHYTGAGMSWLRGARWGMALYTYLFSDTVEYLPSVERFVALLFHVLSAVLFTVLIYIYCRNSQYKIHICTLFGCLYISSPLINEIWNYTVASMSRSCNSVIAAVSILFLYNCNKIINKYTILCAFVLTLVVSSYEASAFLYVTVVLFILLMDMIHFGKKDWLRGGLKYAIPLGGAVILRYVIGFSIIRVLGLTYANNGKTGIYWDLSNNLLPQIKELFILIIERYFFRGLIYFPINIFVLSFIVGGLYVIIFSFKRKNIMAFLLYILLCGSLFLPSVLQGTRMPYRIAQNVEFFSSAVLTMTVFALSYSCKLIFYYLFLVLACFTSFRQAVFLNQTLSLNNQRSDNEAAIVYNIGTRLKSMYDNTKPVVIVGTLDLGDYINRQRHLDISKPGGWLYRKICIHLGWNFENAMLYENDVITLLNWNRRRFGGQGEMAEYFSYYGFDFNFMEKLSQKRFNKYTKTAREENMQPLEIRDMGEYILVYLG